MLRPEKMVPQQPELATSIWADIYAAAESAAEQEPVLEYFAPLPMVRSLSFKASASCRTMYMLA